MHFKRNSTDKPSHPFVFTILILPFGVVQGYLTVTLAYLYSKAGMPVERIAALVGISMVPNLITFLWAPLVDLTFTVKKWYIIASCITAAGVLSMGALPIQATSSFFRAAVIFFSSFAATFIGLAVSSFMAYDTTDKTKGRAGGYYNIGGLGGSGLGGGGGLWLAQRLSAGWMVGKAKAGVFALFLSFLPFGTGAASNLFAAIAKDWNASANVVAIITGIVSAVLISIGCMTAGWICDVISRQLAYVLFGAFQAFCATGMAFFPHTAGSYIVWTLAYSFGSGLSYAGFSAFVLEAIGKGAASTKYHLYSGLSNTPIYMVTLIDGWAYARWGPNGMLNTEAMLAFAGIALFFICQKLIIKKPNLRLAK